MVTGSNPVAATSNPSILLNKLLNKLSVAEAAELSNLSRSYVSQVKHGKRPPSEKFLRCLRDHLGLDIQKPKTDYFGLFLQSRQTTGCSAGTMHFYQVKLGNFLSAIHSNTPTKEALERFLLQFKNPGNRHAYFRAIRTYFNWRERNFGLASPMEHMTAPKVGKLIMPALEQGQVLTLLRTTDSARDKAIIALFAESGMRLSELTNVRAQDIDWQSRTIRTIGKGNKEGLAPFGELSEGYLKDWLSQYQSDGNIWGLNQWGIISMLRRLEEKTGLTCNPHTFRRTFACLLRKAGIDTMTIKDLGRWESLEMVQRYTRSVNFHDSLKFYKAPLG